MKDRLKQIQDAIAEAAAQAGRDTKEIKLVAVSKTVGVDKINEAIEAGVTIIGENRVQELLGKIDGLLPVEKHMIGHLQSNKAQMIVDKVSLIHSLDRFSLAQKLNQLGERDQRQIPVLVQLNIGKEQSKTGLLPEELFAFLHEISEFSHLQVKGLMCIPPFGSKEEARKYFAQTRELAEKAKSMKIGEMSFDELSMGMSHDFFEAVLEGATYVRVGSAIFGERDYSA